MAGRGKLTWPPSNIMVSSARSVGCDAQRVCREGERGRAEYRGLSFPIYRDWMKSFSAHALLVIRAWQDKSGGTGTKAP